MAEFSGGGAGKKGGGRSGEGARNSQISKPMDVQKHLHVEWDPTSGTFKGLPKEWAELLPKGTAVETSALSPQDKHIAPPMP
ncbi:unnamed protein product [Choristocarpus tenellus]